MVLIKSKLKRSIRHIVYLEAVLKPLGYHCFEKEYGEPICSNHIITYGPTVKY